MTLDFMQIHDLTVVFNEIKDTPMPFKLSLIIAKNMDWLEKEFNFFQKMEQEFATKYLVADENGFVKTKNGGFQIKDGLQKECLEAREALDHFSVEVSPILIDAKLLEDFVLSPRQVKILSLLLKEGEQNGS